MKLYYRISDQSYEKPKLPGINKQFCLANFLQAFASIIFTEGPSPMKLIADRCDRATVKMISETGIPMELTDLGNAGSLRHALHLAIKECSEEELFYICEDDYLHLQKSPQLLQEGIKRADYVTLYDHPDKYTRYYDGGEISKVIKTASSHWRYTASTCMTFGVKAKTIKEDIAIWEEFTSESHPWDHEIFKKLGKDKRRRLAVCIPGVACHTDLTFSGAVSTVLMESWAIDLMIDELEYQCGNIFDGNVLQLVGDKQGWERLVALHAIVTAT